MTRWLARLRHDLLKHAAWRARDLSEGLAGGRAPSAADVVALRRSIHDLPDDEGRPAGLLAVWREHRERLGARPPEVVAALDRFEVAVVSLASRAIVGTEDSRDGMALCEAVLALDAAFDRLAHEMKQWSGVEWGEWPDQA